MEYYDAEFVRIAQKGDILLGGYNFGSGSSREQAVTALKHKEIQAVLAGSFSETYKRNAINNGLIAIESSDLLEHIKETSESHSLTNRLDSITISIKESSASYKNQEFTVSSTGTPAQEIIRAGGLEALVNSK